MQRNLADIDKAIVRLIATYLDYRSTVRLSGVNRHLHNALTSDPDHGAIINPSFKFANCVATRSKLAVAEKMLKEANEKTRLELLTRVVHISDIPTRLLNMSALYFVVSWAKDTATRNMIMRYVNPEQIKPYLQAAVVERSNQPKSATSFNTAAICSTLEKFTANTDASLVESLFNDVIRALGTLPAHYKSELARQDRPLLKDGQLRSFDSTTTLPAAQVTTDGASLNPFKNPGYGSDYAFVRTRGKSVKITKSDAAKYSTETYEENAGPKLFSLFSQAITKLDETRSNESTQFVTQVCGSSSLVVA